MKIRLVAEAEDELENASNYFDAISKPVGDAFVAEFRATIDRIIANPNAWPPAGRRLRRCLFRRYNYQIVYRLEADEIVIYAVAHQSRRPGYRRSRVRR